MRRSLRPALLLIAAILAALPALAQSYTISASNVTITTSGGGSIPFTLSSVKGFIGTIAIGCELPTVAAGVKIPSCGGGPVLTKTLTAGEVINSSINLNSYGTVEPVGFLLAGHPALTIVLAVALLAGLTLRRRSARRFTLPLALLALAALSFLSGCGTPGGFTPGTYTYTVTAAEFGSPAPLSQGANAIVTIR